MLQSCSICRQAKHAFSQCSHCMPNNSPCRSSHCWAVRRGACPAVRRLTRVGMRWPMAERGYPIRLCPPGAAAEIWREFRSTIITTHQIEAFQVCKDFCKQLMGDWPLQPFLCWLDKSSTSLCFAIPASLCPPCSMSNRNLPGQAALRRFCRVPQLSSHSPELLPFVDSGSVVSWWFCCLMLASSWR